MIKIETEKDGKINAAICGAPEKLTWKPLKKQLKQ